jgi:hypothetical protein
MAHGQSERWTGKALAQSPRAANRGLASDRSNRTRKPRAARSVSQTSSTNEVDDGEIESTGGTRNR